MAGALRLGWLQGRANSRHAAPRGVSQGRVILSLALSLTLCLTLTLSLALNMTLALSLTLALTLAQT